MNKTSENGFKNSPFRIEFECSKTERKTQLLGTGFKTLLRGLSNKWNGVTITVGKGIHLRNHVLDYSAKDLRNFLKQKERNYFKFEVEKRGTKEMREVNAPNPELKMIQKHILWWLYEFSKVSDTAHGFVPERGNWTAASEIAVGMKQNKRNSILTQDLRKAFDSVTEERVRGIFRGLGLRGFSLHAATRLTTHDGKLATGAPTSPHLLNLLCYEIDNKLANWAEKRGGTYRRYADDITLSLPTWRRRNLKHGKELMRRLFAEIGIDLHPRKSKITRLGLDSPSAEVIGLAVQPNRATRPKRIRNRLRGKIRQCRKLIKTGDTDYAEFILQTVIGLANYCAGEKLALPNARSKQLLAKRFHKT